MALKNYNPTSPARQAPKCTPCARAPRPDPALAASRLRAGGPTELSYAAGTPKRSRSAAIGCSISSQ